MLLSGQRHEMASHNNMAALQQHRVRVLRGLLRLGMSASITVRTHHQAIRILLRSSSSHSITSQASLHSLQERTSHTQQAALQPPAVLLLNRP